MFEIALFAMGIIIGIVLGYHAHALILEGRSARMRDIDIQTCKHMPPDEVWAVQNGRVVGKIAP